MKSIIKISAGVFFLSLSTISCKKNETEAAITTDLSTSTSEMTQTDSPSVAASQIVKDKQFIKTAEVDMEVKNVYDASLAIEKSLVKLGGFVTKSQMRAQSISEEVFNTSDTEATMLRKFRNENQMQVRIPTEFLGDFLNDINQSKLFLNTRIINAEDVTANIAYSKLESERYQKKQQNINQLKTNKDKVELTDNNMKDNNDQQIAKINIADQLKYSSVSIYLKEPNISIAQIPISNVKNFDNQYKNNFGFELKNALVEGFYRIQKIIVFLVSIWPFLSIIAAIFYLNKRKNWFTKLSKTEKY